jgi:hypothetical protein
MIYNCGTIYFPRFPENFWLEKYSGVSDGAMTTSAVSGNSRFQVEVLYFFSFFFFYSPRGFGQIIICECGELVGRATFKDYIKTSANPSTKTIGHGNCGVIFNFVDEKKPKKYSSRKELKILAGKFAEKNLPPEYAARFLLEVDRLKSRGRLQDSEILVRAYREFLEQSAGSPSNKDIGVSDVRQK